MGANLTNNTAPDEQPENRNDIQLSDIVAWTLSHKWFIAISLIACILIGGIYAYRTQPIYQRSSSIMIRTDKDGNAEIGELATFQDLGMFNTGIDVFNEIEAFRSPILMERIVTRLELNTTYSSSNWIGRVTDLYDKTPVKVEFENPITKFEGKDISGISFKISKSDGGTFLLSKFKINGKEVESQNISAPANKSVKTPAGILKISPTLFFDDNFNNPVTVNHVSTTSAANAYLAKLSIELADKRATVINFGFTDTSAKRAEDILNTLLDVYNEEWVNYMNESTSNTSKFIGERLIVIEKELNMVDSDIERFKSQNKLLDVMAETTQVTEESSKYSDAAFQANNQLTIARYIREYLTDHTKAFNLLPSNSGIENQNIETQIAEYNKLLLERKRLADSSSDSNPLVSDLNNQLTMMRTTILRSVDNLISTLKIQADRIAQQEDEIADKISASPGKVRELLSIERQQKIKEQLYLYLLQKREENELSASIVVNNTRLLKPAMGTSRPISPNKMMIIAISIILGLAIPYGYMFLDSMTNTSVRGRKDLEVLTPPILGEIPFNGTQRKFSKLSKLLKLTEKESELPSVVVKPHSRDVINEAYRVIRTNIDFMLGKTSGTQTIMLTSYNIGSGKTYTAVNLAASMAIKNKRVIIIDLDIRKATVSKVAGTSHSTTGVTAYLNGQADLKSIIKKDGFGIKNLDIIPVGMIPPNPSELLLDTRLEDMIKELKNEYDYIFLDCPPVGIVADSSIIARVADRTIFVIRAGLMDRRMLPEIEKIYKEKHYPNMSILLNGSSSSLGYYSYGYGRYGYGGGKNMLDNNE